MKNRLRVGILALSPIADDPRVRRQGDALVSAGFDVTAFGQAGGVSSPPAWPVRTLAELPALASAGAPIVDLYTMVRLAKELPSQPAAARRSQLYRAAWERLKPFVEGVLRKGWPVAAKLAPGLRQTPLEQRIWLIDYYARLMAVRLDKDRAEELYWGLHSDTTGLFNLAYGHRADLWIANDWNTLPIAAQLASMQGAAYVYDSHELAHDEHGQNWVWRTFLRPTTFAIEHKYIGGALAVSAVSRGIAERLKQLHALPAEPAVIRNTPRLRTTPFRATGERVRVLYHGIVVPGRGLEACIRSVRRWRPEFDLTIRGPVTDQYRAVLEQEIAAAGASERVEIAPAVPMERLVAEASAFDVGLFALPGHSKQNVFALPNKLFEYAMAGLCLCVSDMPEMKATVLEHGMGVVFHGAGEGEIAKAINSLTRDGIDRFKAASLVAAKALCWEAEQARMLGLYRHALEAPRPTLRTIKSPKPPFPPPLAKIVCTAGPDAVQCPSYWRDKGADVEAAGPDAVRITTPAASYHYAASIPLDLSSIDFEREYCWIRVWMDRAEGQMMLSVFDLEGNMPHFECVVAPLDGPGEVFLTPTAAAGDVFMFRNGGSEERSSAIFRGLDVLVYPR